MKSRSLTVAAGLVVFGIWSFGLLTIPAPLVAETPDKASPELLRARKTVLMLDDVYKTAVVLITDKYVHDETDFPAGSAAIALFEAINKKGWHTARLIDVTGEPYDEKNVAQDAVEKAGVKKLQAGESYYEEVVDINGQPHLRALTAVPVVLQKCVMCHPHYADVKPGAAIGAISYSIPLE